MPLNFLSLAKCMKVFLWGTKHCRQFYPNKIKILPNIVENRPYSGAEIKQLFKKFSQYYYLEYQPIIDEEEVFQPQEITYFLNRCSILNLAFSENCLSLAQHCYVHYSSPTLHNYHPILDRAVMADNQTHPEITLDLSVYQNQVMPGGASLHENFFPYIGKDL